LSEFEATGGGVEGGGETAEGFEGSAESAVEDTGEDEFSADGGVIINSGEEEFSETESFLDEGLDEGEISADGGVIINSSEEEAGLFRRGFSFPPPTPIPLPPVSEPLSVTGTSEGFPDTTNTPSTPIRELLESDFLRGNFRRLFCRLVGLAGFPGNGQQHRYAFCNTNIIGAIPSFDNMVSTIITRPPNGAVVPMGFPLTITLRSTGMQYGIADDPVSQYANRPQTLSTSGRIQAHNHITIQKSTSLSSTPDPRTPAHLQGLNSASATGE